MMIPDMVNGGFELFGFVAGLHNCAGVYKDKEVKGVRLGPTVFFVLWGCWNLYYYPHLHQLASFVGSALLTATNVVYGVMLWWYARATKVARG